MLDVLIRIEGRAGRITLNRPKALNALSHDMCLKIEAALEAWQHDTRVALVLIDAAGDKAFCAGGDIQEMYDTGTRGDFSYGRRFWADEYRLNARIADYPKPYVALMQGFTMGGGVGVSCHGSHRIVGDSSRIAMPECGIGLVPDVGGSWLLARSPGNLGEYLALTATRMLSGDAIYAGFADHYVPELKWKTLADDLADTGNVSVIAKYSQPAPESDLMALQADINRLFARPDLAGIVDALERDHMELATNALKSLGRNSPLSMAVTIKMLHNLRKTGGIHTALAQEYCYTYRAMEQADFLEGIRAAIIDKDRTPRWRHDDIRAVAATEVDELLAPLGEESLVLKEKET